MIQKIQALQEKGLYSAITCTEIKALKKSRLTKEPTPENLLVIKKYTYQTISLGHTYEDLVNLRLTKEQKENDFKAEATYVEKVEGTLALYKHNTKEQMYLRAFLIFGPQSRIKTVYTDAHGNVIPKEIIEDIRPHYLPKVDSKASQGGLENKVELRNYKIESILYLKRKDTEIISNELTDDVLNMLIEAD